MPHAHSRVQERVQQAFEDVTLEGTDRVSGCQDAAPIADHETDRAWQSHPIDIRISVPFLFGRWYFTLVGGPERRDKERRESERRKHPLTKLGNIILLFLFGSVVGTAVAVLMINGAIELLDGSHSVIIP